MFEDLQPAPPDPILGLTETFTSDPREGKINLGVGVFVDDTGTTPVLATVSEAERRLATAKRSKSYLPILGSPAFAASASELCFGDDAPEHVVTAATPGGTGALRVAAEVLHMARPDATVWLSDPTWANHHQIFPAGGLGVRTYPYFDPTTHGVDRSAFQGALEEVPAGDVVVLHAACHNPTGADLGEDDWRVVVETAGAGGWFPLLDFAYQGFGDGLEEDAVGVRTLARAGVEFAVAQSFSKNFGLYQERVGALHLVCSDEQTAVRVASQTKVRIRANYSNPPAHGGSIVSTILGDEDLRARWTDEVGDMRARINGIRGRLVDAVAQAGVGRDFSFLARQRGMFSYTGLSIEQVRRLRDEHAVYVVDSGRINVAGITSSNLPRLVEAIGDVVG